MKLPQAFALGAASHTGRVRVNNEDDYLLGALAAGEGELLLCAIADGMGGAAGGAEASRTALRALGSAVLDPTSARPITARLEDGFLLAAARVFEQATAVPALHDMGTTLTALCLLPGGASAGHVGDTRLYRRRGGALELLTTDHALRVPENVLTRCIGGGQAECEPDYLTVDTARGDRFVLLTDGVWSVLPPADLASLTAADDPQGAAEALVAAALAAGGPDNATAIVVDVMSTAPSAAAHEIELARDERPGPRAAWPRARSLRPAWWPWLALLVAAALGLAAGLRWWGGIDVFGWLGQKW